MFLNVSAGQVHSHTRLYIYLTLAALFLLSIRDYIDVIPGVGPSISLLLFFVAVFIFPMILYRILFPVMVLILIGFISSLLSPYDFESFRFFGGAWYLISPVIFYIIYSHLKLDEIEFIVFSKGFFYLLLCSIFFSIINVFVGGVLVTDFINPFAIMRFQSALMGSAPIFIAAVAIFVVCSLYLKLATRKNLYYYGAIIGTLVVISSFSRKTILALSFVWLFYFAVRYWRNKGLVVLIYCISVASAFILLPGILERFSDLTIYFDADPRDYVARTALLIVAFDIANDFFPFGLGFGYYASPMASLYYSPVYFDYGLSSIYGLQHFAPYLGGINFLTDTFFPALLGELGLVGLLLFFILCLYPFYATILIVRFSGFDERTVRFGFVVLSIYVLAFFESMGSPVVINPFGLIIFSGMIGMSLSVLRFYSRTIAHA